MSVYYKITPEGVTKTGRSSISDLRKTILWEPELQLGEDGTVAIKFYNGDRYTRIKCVLEGITEDGIPVHACLPYLPEGRAGRIFSD